MAVLCPPGSEWLLFLAAFSACCWLMMAILCSPGSKWLLCLAVFQACWWYLSFAFQSASAVPCYVLNLLKIPVLCSPVGEWLLCLAVFWTCSIAWCLSSALQEVSGCFCVCWWLLSWALHWSNHSWHISMCGHALLLNLLMVFIFGFLVCGHSLYVHFARISLL